MIGTSSWKEQFTEAFTISPAGKCNLESNFMKISINILIYFNYLKGDGDGDDDDEGVRDNSPSCGDYFMHFLTLFWKLLFAFIPPTGNNYLFNYLLFDNNLFY